jgi:hypothetical protein
MLCWARLAGRARPHQFGYMRVNLRFYPRNVTFANLDPHREVAICFHAVNMPTG